MGLSCSLHLHSDEGMATKMFFSKASNVAGVKFTKPDMYAPEFEIFISGATERELQAIADAINAPLDRMRAEYEAAISQENMLSSVGV